MNDSNFMPPTILLTANPEQAQVLNLQAQLQKAQEEFNRDSHDTTFLNQLIYVCNYDDYLLNVIEEAIGSYNYAVIDKRVYLLANPTSVHSSAQSLFCNSFKNAIDNASQKGKLSMVFNGTIPICANFFCGSISGKMSDGSIITTDSFSSQSPSQFLFPQLVFEVAFTHEPLHILFLELVHYLSEFVPHVEYAVGIWINPNRGTTFQASIIMLRRLVASNDEKCNELRSSYLSNKKYMPSSCCTKFINGAPITYNNDFIEENFKVTLQAKYDIDDSFIDSGASIAFNLDGNIFGSLENIDVIIPNEMLHQIRSGFSLWSGGY